MASYGVATNLVVPLQQQYGALPVIWRAQMVAIVLAASVRPGRHPGLALRVAAGRWRSWCSAPLGTGIAFLAAGTLIGRVGATRGSILAYLIPVVAVVLGALLRDEAVEAIAAGRHGAGAGRGLAHQPRRPLTSGAVWAARPTGARLAP